MRLDAGRALAPGRETARSASGGSTHGDWAESLLAALAVLTAWPSAASAQTKLKWAHVYEIAEPYHTEALWAAEEIKKRTNGSTRSRCFPASQLGNENQINEASGSAPSTSSTPASPSPARSTSRSRSPARRSCCATSITGRPIATASCSASIAKGYEDKTKHKIVALTYYGERMVTANKEIKKPEDMKGMKLRVPPAPLLSDVREIGRRQRHADRLRRGLPRAAAGHRRRPGESAADHHGQEVLRGADATSC